MKMWFFALMAVAVLVSCDRNKKQDIVIGTLDSLQSDILKERRKVMVYLPASASSGVFAPVKYPVIYLLDGDSHFHSVTGMLDQLTRNQLCPEMIVVAIPNTDRSRDLTPSHSTRLDDGTEADFLKTTGGAENFTAFIEKELIPYIDAKYPTAPYRMLIGHSFGGLFAVNSLTNHPGLFNSLISIDPSMWWDRRKLLHHLDTVVNALPLDNKVLFLSIANTMPDGMDTIALKGDTTGRTSHIRSIFELSSLLRKNSPKGFRFGRKYYDSDTHGSVPLISEYDGMRYIFDFYRMKNQDSATVEKVKEHFRMISQRMGYDQLPAEATVNGLGYYFIFQKKYDRAEAFLRLNIENYPASSNVFDSMGDLFLNKSDTAQAIEYFGKALAVKEQPSSRQKLEELKKRFGKAKVNAK